MTHRRKFNLTLILSCAISLSAQGSDSYFEDNFDSGQVESSEQFRWLGSPKISQDQSFSGQYALRFRYGPDAPSEDSTSEVRFKLAPNAQSAPREVWIEYKLRIPLNFNHRKEVPGNNKLLSVWAEKYSSGGNTQVTVEYERSNALSSHLRVLCMTGRGCLKGNFYSEIFEESMRGRWLRMRYHLKVGETDGLTEVWRDDQLVYSIKDYQHFSNSGNSYWRNGYIMGWSNSGFTDVTDFFIDDFKIYTDNPGWDSKDLEPLPPTDVTLQ